MVSFNMIENNPGCLAFMIDAYKRDPFNAEEGFARMDAHGIRGSRLYKLWNDCCGRNTEQAIAIMCRKELSYILRHVDGCAYGEKIEEV